MRNDFNVMKDLAVHTRLTPEQRQREVGRLIDYIHKYAHCLGHGHGEGPAGGCCSGAAGAGLFSVLRSRPLCVRCCDGELWSPWPS